MVLPIDGEVVCWDEKGVTSFQLLRHRRTALGILYAFNLLELDADHAESIEVHPSQS